MYLSSVEFNLQRYFFKKYLIFLCFFIQGWQSW